MNLRRGDIFWGDFGHKCRPYIVVSNDIRNSTNQSALVVPLTTKLQSKVYKTHVPICFGSISPSTCQVEDLIRIEDKDNKLYAVEHLPKEIMVHVDNALREALGL